MNHLPILIIVARFYENIADELVQGATACLDNAKLQYEIVEVPGAFEIPAAVAMAFDSHPHNHGGVIALGCVIRGETSHYDYVCSESARGLNDLAMKYALPMGYGILTCENMTQAERRANRNDGNKGKSAAEACIAMMKLKEKL